MTIGDQSATLQWIANHAVAAGIIIPVLLVSFLATFAAYKFMGIYVGVLGRRMATQHAELRRAIGSFQSLDGILNRLLGRLSATRAGLYRFHNGIKDTSAMPFFFVSVTNMVGTNINISTLTNLPASVYAPALATIVVGDIWISKIDTLPLSPLRELEVSRGADTLMAAPIQDVDGNLVGMLTIVWAKADQVPLDISSAATKLEISGVAARLSGYFSLPPIRDPR